MMQRAPGPKGLPLLGNAFELRQDKLDLLLNSQRDYGDIVRFTLGSLPMYVVTNPEYVKQILHTRRDNYDKSARSSVEIAHLSGRSVLVSNDTDWQRKRRLMQSAFRPQRVAAYADLMRDCCDAMMRGWITKTGEFDLASSMMHLTYRIVGLAMLSDDLEHTSAKIERAMTRTLRHIYKRINGLATPMHWPTPGNISFRRERRIVHEIVNDILQRRAQQPERTDLLGSLIAANAEGEDAGLDKTWLRDEVVTLLLAGHETTANALTWAFYLLAKHPQVEQKVYEELQRVLRGEPPTLEQLSQLTYLTQVFEEAMRLYPPIWAIERRALADDQLGGYRIEAGATVFVSIYGLHRDAKYWNEPEKFDPDRFDPERRKSIEDFVYMPFGSGPRMCVGMNFAWQEAMIILSMVIQRYHLQLRNDVVAKPMPGITLRTKNKLIMIASHRPRKEEP